MYTHNKDLKTLNTFGLPCHAVSFFQFSTEEELTTFIKSGEVSKQRVLVVGGGSNILFSDDFDGLVIHPVSSGIRVEHITNEHVIANVSAGVIWDDFVLWAVGQGLGGIENLSFIPGLTGAAPVQNIGAYGSEVKETLLGVRCVMLSDGKVTELTASECKSGYRDSIFKNELKGKSVVTGVRFRLSRHPVPNLTYSEVANECEILGGTSIDFVRGAIINLRKRKLPDPAETGNAGSFFKNPVVSPSLFSDLMQEYPDIPGYHLSDGTVKIAAGWLIDQCGWKGKRVGDAGVHPRQALVLVNYGNARGNDIIELAERIKASVSTRFAVDLVPEVEII